MLLIKYGVPPDMAFAMKRPMRIAALIVYGEHDGGSWDWGMMRWEKPKTT